MDVQVPLSWILGTITGLAVAISTLAGIMWSFVKSRIDAQDRIIESQNSTIEGLRSDVDRMAKGCGAEGCVWKH